MLQMVLEWVKNEFRFFCSKGTTLHCSHDEILQMLSDDFLLDLQIEVFLDLWIKAISLLHLELSRLVDRGLGLADAAGKLKLFVAIDLAVVSEEVCKRLLSVDVRTDEAFKDRNFFHVHGELF